MKNYRTYHTGTVLLPILGFLIFLQACEPLQTIPGLSNESSTLNDISNDISEESNNAKKKEEDNNYQGIQDRIGTIIHINNRNYKIIERIDEGSCGYVYKACEEATVTPFYALKLLKDANDQEDIVLKEIMEEPTLKDHPNIVKYYGYEKLDGEKWLALEYIDGKHISDKDIGKDPNLSRQLKETYELLRKLKSLKAYRDPHENSAGKNIMLTKNGEGQSIIKLIDFGTTMLHMLESPTLSEGIKSSICKYIKECNTNGIRKIISSFIKNSSSKGMENEAKEHLKNVFEKFRDEISGNTPKELLELVNDRVKKQKIKDILVTNNIIEGTH